MNGDNPHCRLAAKILTGDEDNYGILDYRFVRYLNTTAERVGFVGGALISRQIVALAITTWETITGLSARAE